jgi:hypothetical protein
MNRFYASNRHFSASSRGAIFTRDELLVLVEQNRIAPLSSSELRKLHEIKRMFQGRIAR